MTETVRATGNLRPTEAMLLNSRIFVLPGFAGLSEVNTSENVYFAFHPKLPPFNDSMTVSDTAKAMREEAERRVKAGVDVVTRCHDVVEAKAGLLDVGFEVRTTNREEFMTIISKYCTSGEQAVKPIVTWIECTKGSSEPVYVMRASEFYHKD